MKQEPISQQGDMFKVQTAISRTPLVLELRGIEVPKNKSRKDQRRTTDRPLAPNYHVPSFKNSKVLVAKDRNGRPLATPFLITKPELAQWMEKAIQSLESQLLSKFQTGSDGTQQVRSKLFAILSLLPADDSVNDLTEGSWTVQLVPPGEEGATITIERL